MWVKRFLLVAVLWLIAWPALAQNPTCPTRPVGDSSNACASTAFVQAAVSNIISGRPWCDPVGFGAGTGVAATDLAAFNSCKAVLAALNGGTIFLQPGYTFCTGGFTMDVGFSRIVGQAQLIPTMSACGADVTPLTVTAPFVTIERIGVQGYNNPAATKPALKAGAGSGGMQVLSAYISFGSRPCETNGGNDHVWEDFLCIFGYGDSNFYIANNPGTHIRGGSVDQAWPVSIPAFGSTTNAWAATTAYSVGDVVTSGGFYLQARVAGTSGGTAPILQPYFVDIADGAGTLKWQIVSNTGSCAMRFDSGASEIDVVGTDFSSATNYSACTSNTTTGGVPNHIQIDAGKFTIAVSGAFFAEVGYNITVENSHLRGCVKSTCFALGVGATYSETLMASHNFLQFAGNGAIVASGKGIVLDGNYISNNVNDIQITAGVSGVKAVNNTSGGASTIGLLVVAGAGDKLVLEDNDFSLAGTPISYGATGNNVLLSNISGGGAGVATRRVGSLYSGSLPLTSTSLFVGNAALDQTTVATNYALLQTGTGQTILNSSAGQTLDFRIGNNNKFSVATDGGFVGQGVAGGSKGNATLNVAGIYDGGNRVAISASSPLSLSATTGALSIPSTTGTGSTVVLSAGPTFTGSPVLSTPSATTLKVGSGAGAISGTVALVTGNATTVNGACGGCTTYLHLVGNTGEAASLVVDAFAQVPIFGFRRANTSAAAPSAVAAGDQVGIFGFYGHDGTTYGTAAFIRAIAIDTFSGTQRGTSVDIETTPSGSTTLTSVARVHSSGGMSVGSAVVGTDNGNGTILASGAIRSNTSFNANGSAGQSVTTTVRASGGAADCTLIFTFGLKTGGTC